MIKNFKFIIIFPLAIALITLLLPGFQTVQNAYQTGLWTSNVYPPEKATGFTFKLGGDIGYSLEKWNRIRLGFPFKAVTIDFQLKYKILQARIEISAIVVDVLLMSVLGFGVIIFFFGIRKLIKRRRLLRMIVKS
jgi:hypothetical protein